MGKFLLFALAAFVLWKMLSGDFKNKAKQKEEKKHEPQGARSDMVKDPVCGAFVSTAVSVRHVTPEGEVRHFCSEECKQAFVKHIEVADASHTHKG